MSSSNNNKYSQCSENSIPDNKSASSLQPNTIHKICPASSSSSSSSSKLNQPVCGDGSPFYFYYTSPAQKYLTSSSDTKLIIEFLGGGACWSSQTCKNRQKFLYVPTDQLDQFLGYSCSDVDSNMNSNNNNNNNNGGDDDDGAFNGYSLNFLCNEENLGNRKLTEYHYIMVPYCTQDCHMGDSYTNKNNYNVYHHGAHNTMSVLNWIFHNFSFTNPSSSHILLTGCSAGGTVLPIVYDILNKHYNTWYGRRRKVQINTISDSGVYLTPKKFMEKGMPNWNPFTIVTGKTHFDKEAQGGEYDDEFSTRYWEHVLNRGQKKDQWGFISHTYDPVSFGYWQRMTANDNNNVYDDDDDSSNNNDDDDDTSSSSSSSTSGGANQWYNLLTNSLDKVQSTHSENVNVFWMEGEGHCSFGFYDAIQDENFGDFATKIMSPSTTSGVQKKGSTLWNPLGAKNITSPSSSLFVLTLLISSVFLLSAILSKRHHHEKNISDTNSSSISNIENEADLNKTKHNKRVVQQKIHTALIQIGKPFHQCPITTFYFSSIVTYFSFMMFYTKGRIEHPLNNPSLGPSASILHEFGINNPTLVLEGATNNDSYYEDENDGEGWKQRQIYRLFTSIFVCSGIFTFIMVLFCIMKYMRHLESSLHEYCLMVYLGDDDERKRKKKIRKSSSSLTATILFVKISLIIILVSNLVYVMFAYNGASASASCGSLSFCLGMNAFLIGGRKRILQKQHDFQEEKNDYNNNNNNNNNNDEENENELPNPWASTIIFTLCTLILPFESIIMSFSAILSGFILVPIYLRKEDEYYCDNDDNENNYESDIDDDDSYYYSYNESSSNSTIANKNNSKGSSRSILKTVFWKIGKLIGMILSTLWSILFFLFVIGKVNPPSTSSSSSATSSSQLNGGQYPYLTGCKNMHTLDAENIAKSFSGGNNNMNGNGNNGNMRLLEEQGQDQDQGGSGGMCAMVCVPNIATNILHWGVKQFTEYSVEYGSCEEIGYGEHIADHTMSYFGYSFDVELYYESASSSSSSYGDDV